MKQMHWRLPQLMAERGWNETSVLRPKLAEQGVDLSREQVFRLVKRLPERLSMATLMALCAIFDCTTGDIIGVGSEDAVAPKPRVKKKTQPAIPVTRVRLT
ncbi:MAG TPA: helix-turn-helix transcriptional regulator [Candidatus Tumulicola sp.]|jgi:DNA-binding Xre family transcriptional regulator